jgi:Amt family ammonium transporter
MSMVVLLFVIGLLGYWVCGFAFQWGGAGVPAGLGDIPALTRELSVSVFGKRVGYLGFQGFLLNAASTDAGVLVLFLFQAMLMATAIVIPTGALAERWRLQSVVLFGCVMSMLLYPLVGNWVWGGGWLSRLGAVGLGHGFVDFAGSSVVHMTGGVAALAGAIVLGPRLQKFTRDGRPVALPGHSVPMAMAGTLILGVGWLGLTTGAAAASLDGRIAVVAVNTLLASTAAVVAATALMAWRFGTPDPTIMVNGSLAGLAAIAAGSPFVTSAAAVFIGVIAGLLVVQSIFFLEQQLRIDDPVGAISIHGTCGLWGALAVGLFANGTYGEGWNGAAGPVRGLFYGQAAQLAAQAIGVLTCGTLAFAAVYGLFTALNHLVGNRVPPEAELEGLDAAEMGTIAYPDFSLTPPRDQP